MPPPKTPLTLIVATTPVPVRQTPSSLSSNDSSLPKLGIGLNGTLPWPRIKADLSFFARVTTRPPRPGTTNAVIMGRKTYFSVPANLRPLKRRINVVVSRDAESKEGKVRESVLGELERRKSALLSQVPSGNTHENKDSHMGDDGQEPATDALVSSSLDAALSALDGIYGMQGRLGRIFVIGGAQVYASALRMTGRPVRIVMTNVRRKSSDAGDESDVGFDCDTFFPLDTFDVDKGWRTAPAEEVSDWVGERVTGEWRDEGEVMLQMVGYERVD